MRLDYFDLLSPEPIYYQYVGGIICPRLRDISKLTYTTYQMYLSFLMLTPETYYHLLKQDTYYQTLPEDTKESLHIFDLIIQHPNICNTIESALNFFMTEHVAYHAEEQLFFTYKGQKDEDGNEIISGTISRDIWFELCDIVLQRNCINRKAEDLSKVTNKRALKILQKLQKGREQNQGPSKSDENFELGNIISAVANKHETLNIISIWECTIYQLWDAFYRLCSNSRLTTHAINVAVWGDKNHLYDDNAWFHNRMQP